MKQRNDRITAEMCLLASMILDKKIIAQTRSLLKRNSFSLLKHRILHDQLLELFRQNKPIDAVMVCDQLQEQQLLDKIGGAAYLGEILNSVPSAAKGMHYARIVRKNVSRR